MPDDGHCDDGFTIVISQSKFLNVVLRRVFDGPPRPSQSLHTTSHCRIRQREGGWSRSCCSANETVHRATGSWKGTAKGIPTIAAARHDDTARTAHQPYVTARDPVQ
jgi:hypothetical protein